MALVLNASLNELEQNVRSRTQLENRHIDEIKEGLSTIIRQLERCNQATSTALRNDSMSDQQRDDIIRRINAATESLNSMGDLNSGDIVADLNRYATHLFSNDGHRRGRTRENIFGNEHVPVLGRTAQPAAQPASRWSSWPFSTTPSATPTTSPGTRRRSVSGPDIWESDTNDPVHNTFSRGGYKSIRSLRKKSKRL